MSKNNGFEAWKARLSYINSEFPFGPINRVYNEEGRLHCDDAPAFISPTRITWFKNGRKHGLDVDKFGSISYYYEDVRIPPNYWNKPEALTVQKVLAHANAEVRYVGMKIIGLDKVMLDKNTKIIHQDIEKEQILFSIDGIFTEAVCFVKVVNCTPEPDGSYKNYYISVPPFMKTCKQAVAWTFGLEEHEYSPQQET